MKNSLLFSFVLLILLSCATATVIKKTDNKTVTKIVSSPDNEKYSYEPRIKPEKQTKIDNDIYDDEKKIITNNSKESSNKNINNPNNKNSNYNKNNKNSYSNNKSNSIYNSKDSYKNNYNKENTNLNSENNNPDNNFVENINLATVNLEKFKIDENPLREIQVGENQKFSISLSNSEWIIRKLYPNLIKILKRENNETNTLFQFQSTVACNVSITFLRYNAPTNSIWRQIYKISVMPKLFNEVKNNITEESASKDNKPIEEPDLVFDSSRDESNIYKENYSKKEKNKKNKEESNYRLDMANQQFNEKKYNEAAGLFNEIINSGEGTSEIYYKLGIIEKSRGNIDKSNEYFKKVIEENDDLFYSEALMELLKNLQAQKKYLEAIDAYYKYAYAKNSNPRYAEDLNLMLSDIYFNMNDYKNASSEYRRFIKRFPNSQNIDKALFFLARALENLKNNPEFKEAYRLYKIILDDYPESMYYNKSKDRVLFLERHYLKIN